LKRQIRSSGFSVGELVALVSTHDLNRIEAELYLLKNGKAMP
jgi:hypothetical protein